MTRLAPTYRTSLDEKISPFRHARLQQEAREREESLTKRYNRLVAIRKREQGQGMAEYAVVLAVITIAVFGALALLSGNIVNAITRVAAYIT